MNRQKEFDLAMLRLRDEAGACAPRESVAAAIDALHTLLVPREECQWCNVKADDEGTVYHMRDCVGTNKPVLTPLTPRAAKAILVILREVPAVAAIDALDHAGDPSPDVTYTLLVKIADQICPGTPGAASWGRCEKLSGHTPPCTFDPESR